jgi:hypothetical protein
MKLVKIKNKQLIVIISFLLMLITSCNNNKTNNNNGYVNADADTSIFEIDVKGDYDKEVFVLVTKLYLKDSCFGSVNEPNIQKAYLYNKEFLGGEYSPCNRSFIYSRIFGKDTLLWTVFDSNSDFLNIITLQDRYVCAPTDHKTHTCDDKFLSVISRSKGGLSACIINFKYSDKGWFVISKEIISTILEKGYSIDTIHLNINNGYVNSPKNEICFRDAFDNFGDVRYSNK